MSGGMEDFVQLTTTTSEDARRELLNKAAYDSYNLTDDELLQLGAIKAENATTPTTNYQLQTAVIEGSQDA